MSFARLCARGAAVCCLPLALGLGGTHAHAHVHWSRPNDTAPDCLALYHLNDASAAPGSVLSAAPGQPAGLGLLVGSPAGAPMTITTDVAEPFFGPGSLALASTQSAESSAPLTDLDGDLTIEFWFKWEPTMTSSSLQVGLESGARLQVTRDMSTPANDRFGVAATHGDFRSAPGFTNWADVGSEEASLNHWHHVALTISSAGIHYDSALGHDVYSTGTVARIYLNGHATGAAPHTLDLTGLRVHDTSRLQIRALGGGGVLIDEVTIWKKDWSENGTVPNPFSDGRGAGAPAAVPMWRLYD